MANGNFATIQPARRFGLMADPTSAWISAAVPATLYRLGAALQFASGLLVEATPTGAAGPATILGFAADPFTSTGSFTTAIGTTTIPAVGSGTAASGVERRFYLANSTSSFVGTLDTSGATRRALAITDVGSSFGLNPVAASGTVTAGGIWILDTVPTNLIATVIRLVDPIGATSADTPVAGVNSGQALVEFVIRRSATAYVGAAL